MYEQQHQDEQEGVVNLTKTLNLVPLVGYKVRPPDADGALGRDGRGTSSLVEEPLGTFPVHEEDINCGLVPHQVHNV